MPTALKETVITADYSISSPYIATSGRRWRGGAGRGGAGAAAGAASQSPAAGREPSPD